MNYSIVPSSDTPIYRQVAEAILRDIKSRTLPAGTKLPTVRELAEEMGLSQGTIKHAYDHLETLGAIEMTQGKGTFVKEQEAIESGSRKDRAMAAIDELLEELESLGFTPREMEIYINLKLRGLDEEYDLVKIAVIDCNPEVLQLMESQLSQIPHTQVACFSLRQIAEIADKLNSDYDIILTTTSHYSEVEEFIASNKVFSMLAMMTSTETIIELAHVPENSRVGVVCSSHNFLTIVRMNYAGMPTSEGRTLCAHLLGDENLEGFLKHKDVIIVPKHFETFASSSDLDLIHKFEADGGQLLRYNYVIDHGSYIHAEKLVRKALNSKRSI